MAKSKSSHRWMQEHLNDPWVKKAQVDGYRSRAAYKLLEIVRKDRLLRPGMSVVDLGAAPGGWLQVVKNELKGQGRIIGLDILPIEPIDDVELILGDFTEDEPLEILEEKLNGKPVDLVISDMAPNISGISGADQPRSMYLVELAVDFALTNLKPNGNFLSKVFQGEGFDQLMKLLRENFKKVIVRKPDASRPRSREVYLLARGLK
ncbi:MAG: 23S rRNA (uridine(2552)-2'-O)-methyltransferase RlmE [bacterium]